MPKLVDTQVAAVAVQRAPSTIRSWIRRGKIDAHGKDHKGRTLVDLGQVYRAAAGTRPASVHKDSTE